MNILSHPKFIEYASLPILLSTLAIPVGIIIGSLVNNPKDDKK